MWRTPPPLKPHPPTIPLPGTSFPEGFKQLMWGDKDTFGMAFALAGKAHLFAQVPVPPGKCGAR